MFFFGVQTNLVGPINMKTTSAMLNCLKVDLSICRIVDMLIYQYDVMLCDVVSNDVVSSGIMT